MAGGGSICGIDKCHALVTSKATSKKGTLGDVPVVLPESILSWLLKPIDTLKQNKDCAINFRSMLELFLQNSC